jgi:hypothetical protein
MRHLWLLLLLCVFSVQTQAADDDYDEPVIFFNRYHSATNIINVKLYNIYNYIHYIYI